MSNFVFHSQNWSWREKVPMYTWCVVFMKWRYNHYYWKVSFSHRNQVIQYAIYFARIANTHTHSKGEHTSRTWSEKTEMTHRKKLMEMKWMREKREFRCCTYLLLSQHLTVYHIWFENRVLWFRLLLEAKVVSVSGWVKAKVMASGWINFLSVPLWVM